MKDFTQMVRDFLTDVGRMLLFIALLLAAFIAIRYGLDLIFADDRCLVRVIEATGTDLQGAARYCRLTGNGGTGFRIQEDAPLHAWGVS